MLRQIIVFLFASLIIIAFENVASASPSFVSHADTVIVIDPFPIPDPDRPRLPVIVPISASYESIQTSVILAFSSNLGEIEIEVLNSTIGGYYSGIVDTQTLSAIIPITLGPGHYIITFTLLSGQQYRGEFDV